MNEGLRTPVKDEQPPEQELSDSAASRLERGEINYTQALMASGASVSTDREGPSVPVRVESSSNVVPFQPTRHAPSNGRRRNGLPSGRNSQLSMDDQFPDHDQSSGAA